ncbi:MAG: phenylalanine--tRNA ligase subunit beta, partial [Fidelibacterota bacterium]
MEISLNWLKKYLPITLSPEELEEGLTLLGIECTHESQSLSFSDVVLGRVTECDPHPQSDHLSVCMVDLGGGDQYQIVCGAPNVKAGILVPVAKVGATLSNGEFTIKKAKLRGVASMGMICSGKELQFNEDHEGILILESDLPLGTSIEKVLDFKKDTVFSMDITPNRGDCFSHLGIAREVALLENTSINKPEIDLEETGHPISDQIKIDIQAADGCPRYAARVINNVKVGPSPKWLVEKLQSIGLKSINNVVDAANYVLMDFGHPMHTFDLDKLSAKHIHVRYARENESMVLLDDSEKKLTQDHLLICDGDEPVALAGIMGGRDSEISNGTTNILIESAYFNPVIIRKGAKKLDLSTDASKRFERDTDIKNLIPAMNYLSELIVDLAGGEVAKGILDVYPKKKNAVNVILSLEKCNNLLGISLSKREIITILEKLNISCVEEKNHINCAIPTYRNDLTREVDLIEEIARVYGYEKIPESKIFSGSYQSLTP